MFEGFSIKTHCLLETVKEKERKNWTILRLVHATLYKIIKLTSYQVTEHKFALY
jgi:hypothetical protein